MKNRNAGRKSTAHRQASEDSMWYVIQTVTGREEELIIFIRIILKKELYTECFVIKAEWMKRLGGEWQIQVRPLFPGYVFIETERPDEVFLELKNVPRFSRILGSERNIFVPVKKEEEQFLKRIIDDSGKLDQAVVRLTAIETGENGEIISMEGALSCFEKGRIKVNRHKRYAVVKTRMLGEARTLIFGVMIKRDIEK